MKVTKETVYTIVNDKGEYITLSEKEIQKLQVQLLTLIPPNITNNTGPNTTFITQPTTVWQPMPITCSSVNTTMAGSST